MTLLSSISKRLRPARLEAPFCECGPDALLSGTEVGTCQHHEYRDTRQEVLDQGQLAGTFYWPVASRKRRDPARRYRS